MKEKITRAIELSFVPLVIAFLGIFLLAGLGMVSVPAGYELLGYVLPVLAIPVLVGSKPADDKSLKWGSLVLLAALLFALGIRLLPLMRSSIPLGYDPGFYKYTMELYYNALPQIPETGLADWVRQMHEQGLFVLSDAMYVLAGTTALNSITFIFPLLGALVILPLFVLTRHLFGPKAGLLASILYAVSYTQYTTFTMLYFKNVIGLILLLIAIYALEKQKDGLMALMFAALGIFHRPEFLLFALILIPYFILHRRKGILLAVLGAAVIIAPFWIPRWEAYWDVISGGIGGGTLFDFNTYALSSLAYLSFAIIGTVYLVINKKLNSILFYFLITSVIVVFQLFFFQRFIIMLDISVVILAAVGIEYTLLQKKGNWRAAGATAALLVLLVTGLPAVAESNSVRPRITDEQLRAVEWIKDNAEADAYVMAAGSDAPWILGWSERRVIAPGLFDWYVQSQEEWFEFIDSTDPEVAKEFLDVYQDPVYIYYRKNSRDNLGLEKFQSGYFKEAFNNDGAVIFQYLGGG